MAKKTTKQQKTKNPNFYFIAFLAMLIANAFLIYLQFFNSQTTEIKQQAQHNIVTNSKAIAVPLVKNSIETKQLQILTDRLSAVETKLASLQNNQNLPENLLIISQLEKIKLREINGIDYQTQLNSLSNQTTTDNELGEALKLLAALPKTKSKDDLLKELAKYEEQILSKPLKETKTPHQTLNTFSNIFKDYVSVRKINNLAATDPLKLYMLLQENIFTENYSNALNYAERLNKDFADLAELQTELQKKEKFQIIYNDIIKLVTK